MAKKVSRTAAKSGARKAAPKKTKAAPAKKTGGRVSKPVARKKSESRALVDFVPGPRTYSSEELKKFKEMILAKRQEMLD